MAFNFNSGRSIVENVRHTATDQIASARLYLIESRDGDAHNGIHEARKCFKRLRALLRMIRPVVGKDIYRQENIVFREAGRTLSNLRDAHALLETYDFLAQTYGDCVTFDRMQGLRDRLTERCEHLIQRESNLEERVGDVIAMLEKYSSSVDQWPLVASNAKDLAHGVQRVYKRARNVWKRTGTEQNLGELHDWRKRTKYLRYHFQLLKGIDKDWAGDFHKGFEKLSDLLGDYHDLDILRRVLDEIDDTGLDAVAECEFRTLLREKQNSIYREAHKMGYPLLTKKPKKMRESVRQRLECLPIAIGNNDS